MPQVGHAISACIVESIVCFSIPSPMDAFRSSAVSLHVLPQRVLGTGSATGLPDARSLPGSFLCDWLDAVSSGAAASQWCRPRPGCLRQGKDSDSRILSSPPDARRRVWCSCDELESDRFAFLIKSVEEKDEALCVVRQPTLMSRLTKMQCSSGTALWISPGSYCRRSLSCKTSATAEHGRMWTQPTRIVVRRVCLPVFPRSGRCRTHRALPTSFARVWKERRRRQRTRSTRGVSCARARMESRELKIPCSSCVSTEGNGRSAGLGFVAGP